MNLSLTITHFYQDGLDDKINSVAKASELFWQKAAYLKNGKNIFRALANQVNGADDITSYVQPDHEIRELEERLTPEDFRIFNRVYFGKKPKAFKNRVSNLVNSLNI